MAKVSFPDTVYPVIFTCHKICEKWRKIVTFFICVSHFWRFKQFFIETNTRYNVCVLNILRYKSDREKRKK